MRKIQLDVTRFLQRPSHCSIAASASLANYYNPSIDYELALKVCKEQTFKPDDGLLTPHIGILLNALGFKKVTIISADINILDFAWKKLSKKDLFETMIEAGNCKRQDHVYKEQIRAYLQFMAVPRYNNKLVIDHHFGKHIREAISQKKPILISFNWNLFFEYGKWNKKGKIDPILGDSEEHAVVVSGFDDKGVHIVDSHNQMYFGRLAKYKNGRYTIDWETLHTVMGKGDIIIPDNYKIL